jgi:hypothetical protein
MKKHHILTQSEIPTSQNENMDKMAISILCEHSFYNLFPLILKRDHILQNVKSVFMAIILFGVRWEKKWQK